MLFNVQHWIVFNPEYQDPQMSLLCLRGPTWFCESMMHHISYPKPAPIWNWTFQWNFEHKIRTLMESYFQIHLSIFEKIDWNKKVQRLTRTQFHRWPIRRIESLCIPQKHHVFLPSLRNLGRNPCRNFCKSLGSNGSSAAFALKHAPPHAGYPSWCTLWWIVFSLVKFAPWHLFDKTESSKLIDYLHRCRRLHFRKYLLLQLHALPVQFLLSMPPSPNLPSWKKKGRCFSCCVRTNQAAASVCQ